MGCSAEGGTEAAITYNDEKAGIYAGHAYSICDAFSLEYNKDEKEKHGPENKHQNHRLIVLRNPWGFGEWLLKWSETEENDDKKLEKYIPKIAKHYEDLKKAAIAAGSEIPEE